MANRLTLPPIPPIDGIDLTLAVFTHSSLGIQSTDDYGNADRLSLLGERVLHLAVTDHLFKRKPLLNVEDIEHHRRVILSDETYSSWIDGYGLRAKLRVSPAIPHPLENPEELQKFFHSYVGAVFIRSGMSTIAPWVSQLIDPDQPPPPPPFSESSPSQYPYSNEQPPAPKTLPPPVPPSPGFGGTPMITLASFHEQAAKKGIQVTYQGQSEGQSHLPIWTVRCYVNGEERGMGQGKNQKIAKEEAARRAWATLGW
ncbi:hypothetical protein VKT23_005405 [Stygiomarasmius scandens]|uniref:Uncharacterized protein n=1 Tax=Marasmiellus scandens TaxID=2682957 RepID=A0ABR1JSW7_9AGAR